MKPNAEAAASFEDLPAYDAAKASGMSDGERKLALFVSDLMASHPDTLSPEQEKGLRALIMSSEIRGSDALSSSSSSPEGSNLPMRMVWLAAKFPNQIIPMLTDRAKQEGSQKFATDVNNLSLQLFGDFALSRGELEQIGYRREASTWELLQKLGQLESAAAVPQHIVSGEFSRGDVEANTVWDMGDVIATFEGSNTLLPESWERSTPESWEGCTTFFRLAYELSHHPVDARSEMMGKMLGILNKMADVQPGVVKKLLTERHGLTSSPDGRSAAQLLGAVCPEKKAGELQQLFEKVGMKP
jgi:hypothetical protein